MSSFPHELRTVDGRKLRRGREIGKGGEGAVFEIDGEHGIAVKLYWPSKAQERKSKILAMTAASWHATSNFVAFPKDAVFAADGTFLGFTMGRVGGHKPAHMLYSPASRKQEFNSITFAFLVRAALNVSRAVANVHQTGCVIGDINHSGFLVSEKATVTLIDSDSFQVTTNEETFLCKVGTPEYTPPELQSQRFDRVKRQVNHDNFGTAVLLFQLLFVGRHPYSGRFKGAGDMPLERAISEFRFAYSADTRSTHMDPPPNVPTLPDFPDYIADAFETTFGRRGLAQRITPIQWVQMLSNLEQELVICAQETSHHHIRGKACPWCRMERATPGFFAFSSTRQVIFPSSTVVDAGQLLSLLNGVADPGLLPDLHSVVGIPRNARPLTLSQKIKPTGFQTFWCSVSLAGMAVVTLGSTFTVAGLGLVGSAAFAMYRGSSESRARRSAADIASDEWRRIQNAWIAASSNGQFTDKKNEVLREIGRLRSLPEEERRALLQLEQRKRERQLDRHLERFRISGFKISKISSGRKATLASYGIETAADINVASLEKVPGFGPALIQTLMNWRATVEHKFVFNPAEPLNPIDVAAVKGKRASAQKAIEQKVKTDISALNRLSSNAIAQRSALERSARESYARLKHAEAHLTGTLNETVAKAVSYGFLAIAVLYLLQAGKTSATSSVSTKSLPPKEQVTTTVSNSAKSEPSSLKIGDQNKVIVRDPERTGTKNQSGALSKPFEQAGGATSASGQKPSGIGGPYVPPIPLPPSPLPSSSRDVLVSLPTPIEIPSVPTGSAATGLSDIPKEQLLDLNSKPDAQRVQQKLIELGFLQGVADGIWGPRSRLALADYKKRYDIPYDGNWDDSTQRHLLNNKGAAQHSQFVFAGGWTTKSGVCAIGDAQIQITDRYAETDGGRCNFETVRQTAINQWSIRANCAAGPETWISNITLKRTGRALTWASEKGTETYLLCGER